MELYVLDSQLEQIGYVEGYDSVVWALRYSEHGDFELHSLYDTPLTALLMAGRYLKDAESNTGMFIEDTEVNETSEDGPMATFTGRSLESLLSRRIVWGKRTLYGKLQDIVYGLLNEHIISPDISERRISNFIFQSNPDPRLDAFVIDEKSPEEAYGDSLYDLVKYLCDLFDVGFRITINGSKQFVFQLYYGEFLDGSNSNRRTVLFSPKMENLANSRYYQSTQNYKNVVRVDSSYELKAEQNNPDDDSSASSAVLAATPSWVIFPRNVGGVIDPPLSDGLELMMHFTKKVFASATLNINGTGAKPIYYQASPIPAEAIDGSATVKIRYSSSGSGRWVIDSLDENNSEEPVQQTRTVVVTGSSVSGIERREIFADAGNVPTEDDTTPEDYEAYMERQGYTTLQDNRQETEMDGESIPGVNYIFGQDYNLGDVVKVENEVGIVASLRVIEYVQNDGSEGPSACPTFSSVYI